MKTEVVIVNYRTKELTLDCLQSLRECVRDENVVHVTVVDNHSQDGSADFLADAVSDRGWNSWVSVLPVDRNGGFAYGNNVAIKQALAKPDAVDFVWLLNPDTIVRPGSLASLQHYLNEHPKVGIVGSRLEDPDGTPQRSAFRFPSLLSELDAGLRLGIVSNLLSRFVVSPPVQDDACLIDWVAGASMLVRKEVFDTIGLLDDSYFMYYEEVDFCLQASRAGFGCAYEPASHVVHLVGQASGVTNKESVAKRRPKYWFDSRRRYFVKNHGFIYAGIVDAVWILAHLAWRVRVWCQGKKTQEPPKYLTDFVRNSVLFRGAAT